MMRKFFALIAAALVLLAPAIAPAQLTGVVQPTAGRFIGVQVITATGSGTYTPDAGTNSIEIEMVGGGAGGSGVATNSANNVSIGVGGTGGAFCESRITTGFSGASYSVGAGGTGGASGANNGNNGNSTTFTANSITYTAGGGNGSGGNNNFAPPLFAFGNNQGGSASNCDINVSGNTSLPGVSVNSSNTYGGGGGPTVLGPGGAPPFAGSGTHANGNNALNYGGGGSGAASSNAGGAAAGGNGANGILIIWEYS